MIKLVVILFIIKLFAQVNILNFINPYEKNFTCNKYSCILNTSMIEKPNLDKETY